MISLNPIEIHSDLSRKKDTALKNRAFFTKNKLWGPLTCVIRTCSIVQDNTIFIRAIQNVEVIGSIHRQYMNFGRYFFLTNSDLKKSIKRDVQNLIPHSSVYIWSNLDQ